MVRSIYPSLNRTPNPNRYRREIAVRVLAAVLGGYVLANVVAVIIPFLVPLSTSSAVMTSLLLSFAIYTAAVLWVFSVKSVHRAWLGLAVPSVLLGALAALIKLMEVA